MTWTVRERPAFCEGLPELTVFEIYESDERAMVAGLQSSEHCPGYGWTAAELRERARVMVAGAELLAALERILSGDNSEAAHAEAVGAARLARGE